MGLTGLWWRYMEPHSPSLNRIFLADLVRICGSEQLPILVGGDFNVIRRSDEKNSDNFDGRWSFMFNTIIESLDLREIELSGRKFTWANALPNPTFEKLDRVLASVEWEQKFPYVIVQALTRGISDHTPLFLDSGRPPTWEIKMFFLSSLLGLREKVSWIS